MSESEINDSTEEITIAKWSDRFFAWLIDYIIIFSASFVVYFLVFSASNFQTIIDGNFEYSETFEYAPISLIFFAYWIILEFKTGQSIGKRALNIKITSLTGDAPDLKSIVISSFGKAFILPIDVILGWIFTNKKRQRVFNKFGNTIVIKLSQNHETENISYKMD